MNNPTKFDNIRVTLSDGTVYTVNVGHLFFTLVADVRNNLRLGIELELPYKMAIPVVDALGKDVVRIELVR